MPGLKNRLKFLLHELQIRFTVEVKFLVTSVTCRLVCLCPGGQRQRAVNYAAVFLALTG